MQDNKPSSFFSPDMHQRLWRAANVGANATIMSVGIIAVQMPFKTVLINIAKNGTFQPAFPIGSWRFFQAMYIGAATSFSGSVLRTIYATEAKNSKPSTESLTEAGKMTLFLRSGFMYVTLVTLGDTLITQIPESLSQLKKIEGLIPKDFKWYNLRNSQQLMSNGLSLRFTAGFINYWALCLCEDEFAKRLPIDNLLIKHFIAGLLNGMAAAFISYPFSSIKDRILVQTTIHEGQLMNKNFFHAINEMVRFFINDPRQSSITMGQMALKALPLRMGLSAAVFSIVSLTEAIFKGNPLSRVVPEKYQPFYTSNRYSLFNKASSTCSDLNIDSVSTHTERVAPVINK